MSDSTVSSQPRPTACYRYPRSSYILTEDDWQTILQGLQDGWSITTAARSVGASRQAIYDRINRDPAFGEAITQCKREGIDTVVDLVRQNAERPQNFLDRVAWLKAHDPARWRDDRPQAQTPTINIVIQAPTPSELRQIIGLEQPETIEPAYTTIEVGDDDST